MRDRTDEEAIMRIVSKGAARAALWCQAPDAFAAEELQRYIRLATGATLALERIERPAGRRGRASACPWIWLGARRPPERDRVIQAWLRRVRGLKPGGYGLRRFAAGLLIAGREYAGLVSGVYDVLERVAGIRFIEPYPGGEHVPRRRTLEAPPLDRLEAPAFGYRGLPDASSMRDVFAEAIDWMAKNRMNVVQISPWHWDACRARVLPELSKRGMKLGIFGHCTPHFFPIRPPLLGAALAKYPAAFASEARVAEELKAHPDRYALVNGRRDPGQVCYSNPEVIHILSDNVARWTRQYPEIESLAIGANDGDTFCECERCRAAGVGRLLYEADRAIAETVRRVNPRIVVFHIVYWPGTLAPLPGVKPVRNLVCLYAPYGDRDKYEPNYEYRHGGAWRFLNEADDSHRGICRNLRAWQRTHGVAMFSYFSDQIMKQATYQPLPDVIRENVRYFHALGVRGFIDCLCVHDLWWLESLNLYALAKVLWNPAEDLDAVRHGYYAALFGKAAGPVEAFDRLVGSLRGLRLPHGFLAADVLGVETGEERPDEYARKLARDFVPELDGWARDLMARWRESARTCLREARRRARSESRLVRRRLDRLALGLDNLACRLEAAYHNVRVAWLSARAAEAPGGQAKRRLEAQVNAAIRANRTLYLRYYDSRLRWKFVRPMPPGATRMAAPGYSMMPGRGPLLGPEPLRHPLVDRPAPPSVFPFVPRLRVSRPLPLAGPFDALACPRRPNALGFQVRSCSPDGLCALRGVWTAGGRRAECVFLACRLECPAAMTLKIGVGYDGPLKLWLDGRRRFCDPGGTVPIGIDKAAIRVRAARGPHEMVIALGSNRGRTEGARVRLMRCDLPDTTLQGGPGAYPAPSVRE